MTTCGILNSDNWGIRGYQSLSRTSQASLSSKAVLPIPGRASFLNLPIEELGSINLTITPNKLQLYMAALPHSKLFPLKVVLIPLSSLLISTDPSKAKEPSPDSDSSGSRD